MSQPAGLPDLEEQRAVLAAAGLDVDDTILGPFPADEPPRQPGRIYIKERDSTLRWDARALCRAEGQPTERFFPTRHSTLDDVESTKAFCGSCPVRWACLAYAVINWEKLGIWGGFTEIERREVRRDLKRQISDPDSPLDPSPSSVREYLEARWGGLGRPIRRGEGRPAGDRPIAT